MSDHPDEIKMTRGSWLALQPPYKQDGGRYWPNGTPDLEYYFNAEDEETEHLPFREQMVIFQKARRR